MTAPRALLAPRELAAPLAWSRGAPISAHRFLADVRAQAARMDGAAPVANLCANRYRFAVVLAAAWTRGVEGRAALQRDHHARFEAVAVLRRHGGDDGEPGQVRQAGERGQALGARLRVAHERVPALAVRLRLAGGARGEQAGRGQRGCERGHRLGHRPRRGPGR